jgi:Cdc6-like AAA superfamily ATPase
VGQKVVVCPDEVHQTKDNRILQTLSVRQCALILISNRRFFFDVLEDRLRTRLFLAEVEFRKYAKSELVDILKDRAQFAVSPDTVPGRVIELMALWANGDARVALQTLRAAAMSADSKRRNEITVEDLREAFRGALKSKREYVKAKLNVHQRLLLETVKKRETIDSGELLQIYTKSVSEPIGERAYKEQMEHLVQMGLVRGISEGRWRRFQTT